MNRKQNFKWNNLSLGVCYYPEHWDRNLWQDDLRRMKENGIHTVRVGEFAWSIFEQEEGEFSFELFDSFLNLAEQEEIKVIFGINDDETVNLYRNYLVARDVCFEIEKHFNGYDWDKAISAIQMADETMINGEGEISYAKQKELIETIDCLLNYL